MHFRPRCVVWIVYAFRLGGLCVNGYFVCVGCVRQNITERGRGGACVPARVAPQGRIHRSFPRAQCVYFGMETPLRGRSGGHTGTAPTHFAWGIARGCSPLRFHLGGLRADV